MEQLHGYLLTRGWRDTPRGLELEYWLHSEQGPIKLVFERQQSVFFIRRDTPLSPSPGIERRALALTTLEGQAIDGLYFSSQRLQQETQESLRQAGHRTYESDIRQVDRLLMERFVTAAMEVRGQPQQRRGFREFRNPRIRPSTFQPRLSLCSFDIETDVPNNRILSIAAIFVDAEGMESRHIWLLDNPAWESVPQFEGLQLCLDEASLIQAFFTSVQDQDPDVFIGWNVVGFDLGIIDYKCKQLGIVFNLGRNQERAAVLPAQSSQQLPIARIPGRVVLDGIETLRSASWSFESFALDYVAQELLGRGKLIHSDEDKIAEVLRRYHEAPEELLAYNLEDCQLVLEIFAKADLVAFAIERANLTGLQIGRSGGSVAAFDTLYLPQLHRQGCVAGDIGDFDDVQHSPGGYVMDSLPGMYNNVLVLDFKSLYPSIIRTFRIDPLGLARGEHEDDAIPGFLDGRFSRHHFILPELIETLWQARDRAKRDKNAALSQSIKIIMNSFYGVLGTTGCRFFNPKLASSITRRGHQIIKESKQFIEQLGYQVIYGDTDSVFVWLGNERAEAECKTIGQQLADALNQWWQERLQQEFTIESFLEIEFETHYLKFIMPTVRGSEVGSKKRYAGLQHQGGEHRLVFKGLETVRTDWTRLARDFQQELYRRIFFEEDYEDYIRATAEALLRGELDEQLYYRKRIRRALQDYQKNVPPHIQAARKLPVEKQRRPSIRYVITVNGPEPEGQVVSPLDYQHYLEKQLKPVADGILQFIGTGFEQIHQRQITLF